MFLTLFNLDDDKIIVSPLVLSGRFRDKRYNVILISDIATVTRNLFIVNAIQVVTPDNGDVNTVVSNA